MARRCLLCKKVVVGRSDKKFCSVRCKNTSYAKRRAQNRDATAYTDQILHRNRAILQALLGTNGRKKKIARMHLDRQKFNYDYLTGFHVNTQGKTIHHVYEFSWAIFSDQEVLIYRRGA